MITLPGPAARVPNGFTVLDTYCRQGGSAMGWYLAGFDVTGVDIDDQPRYPFRFIQGDAIHYIQEHGAEYDLVTGSPPCQGYTLCQRIQGREHPRLIGPTREAMRAAGRPAVIENVPEAADEMLSTITLCGASFGLHTYRHRLFEPVNGLRLAAPPHPQHVQPTVKMGRPLKTREDYAREGADRDGDWYHAVGNFSGVPYVARDLNVQWMNREGIRECVPPVYTYFLGLQVLAALRSAAAGAER